MPIDKKKILPTSLGDYKSFVNDGTVFSMTYSLEGVHVSDIGYDECMAKFIDNVPKQAKVVVDFETHCPRMGLQYVMSGTAVIPKKE